MHATCCVSVRGSADCVRGARATEIWISGHFFTDCDTTVSSRGTQPDTRCSSGGRDETDLVREHLYPRPRFMKRASTFRTCPSTQSSGCEAAALLAARSPRGMLRAARPPPGPSHRPWSLRAASKLDRPGARCAVGASFLSCWGWCDPLVVLCVFHLFMITAGKRRRTVVQSYDEHEATRRQAEGAKRRRPRERCTLYIANARGGGHGPLAQRIQIVGDRLNDGTEDRGERTDRTVKRYFGG